MRQDRVRRHARLRLMKWDLDSHTSSRSLIHPAGNLNNKPAARNDHTTQPETEPALNRFALKPLVLRPGPTSKAFIRAVWPVATRVSESIGIYPRRKYTDHRHKRHCGLLRCLYKAAARPYGGTGIRKARRRGMKRAPGGPGCRRWSAVPLGLRWSRESGMRPLTAAARPQS